MPMLQEQAEDKGKMIELLLTIVVVILGWETGKIIIRRLKK